MKTKLLFLASIFALAASAAAYSQPLFDRITMTTTIVSNVQQAKAFYTDDLGFKVTKDYGAAGLRWVTVVPQGGGTPITLTDYPGNKNRAQCSITSRLRTSKRLTTSSAGKTSRSATSVTTCTASTRASSGSASRTLMGISGLFCRSRISNSRSVAAL